MIHTFLKEFQKHYTKSEFNYQRKSILKSVRLISSYHGTDFEIFCIITTWIGLYIAYCFIWKRLSKVTYWRVGIFLLQINYFSNLKHNTDTIPVSN